MLLFIPPLRDALLNRDKRLSLGALELRTGLRLNSLDGEGFLESGRGVGLHLSHLLQAGQDLVFKR